MSLTDPRDKNRHLMSLNSQMIKRVNMDFFIILMCAVIRDLEVNTHTFRRTITLKSKSV